MQATAKNLLKTITNPIVTVILALLIGSFLVLPTGTSPVQAYAALFRGAFGSTNALLGTLMCSTPLLFCGLSACIALKSNVFNIGIEGQMHIGALAAGIAAVYFGSFPGWILIPICFICAGFTAMLWSVIPAFLKSKYNISLIISSIMMNNLGILLTTYLASYPLKGDLPLAATQKIPEHAVLPKLSHLSDFNVGFFLALMIAILLYFIIFRTPFGYEIRALGISQSFAKYIGVNINKKFFIVMFVSALIAGFAGAETFKCFSGYSDEVIDRLVMRDDERRNSSTDSEISTTK
ncbi:MAG TPA: ABC transporter permease [Fastidiosipila sp.]|nr:ABC transporter permease [Fastidiosipila sp.]